MQPNEILKKQFLEIVDNQLERNDPPETRQTLGRLKKDGYSDTDARMLIAQCVAAELFNVMNENEPYDKERYVKNLNNLPDFPSEQ